MAVPLHTKCRMWGVELRCRQMCTVSAIRHRIFPDRRVRSSAADKDANADGIVALSLKGGPGCSVITLRGRDAFQMSALPLSQESKVAVQLKNDLGQKLKTCGGQLVRASAFGVFYPNEARCFMRRLSVCRAVTKLALIRID